MTNNPTIDGVSLRISTALAYRLVQKYTATDPEAARAARLDSLAAHDDLRALLDAPVVERQLVEDVVQMASMPVERCYDVRAKMIIAFNEAKKAGGDLDDQLDAAYKAALRYSPAPQDFADQQSTIAQLRIDLGNQTELTKQADYHASQRGREIAQLQARIAELESGRGDK